ncbi:polysaccharide deacetylase family protein [Enterococcus canintestini]|uniref:Deacetylase n=1 Tax=Enterococcus canintestini TaxID=317010 RepID=A0A267HT72_9ENTE|nr:polysaccharide deacetylase family protein [Enterococcus canintestini]PAB00708.1 deacetylase [Enterococcus canintestini]
MFTTLVFHEIRPLTEIQAGMRPIQVADGYADSLPLPLYNDLDSFSAQIDYLIAQQYHFLTLAEVIDFYAGKFNMPEKSVLLTFDDCYQSQLRYAYPILQQRHLTAVSFVPTGWIFQKPTAYAPEVSRPVSFPELLGMADVFTYANHTHHFHQRKGTTASRAMWEKEKAFIADLKACNQFVPVKDVFAYPFGLYDEKNVTTLAKENFKLAFTTIKGMNLKDTNPLELRRNVVPAQLPLAVFKEILGEKE